MTPPKRAIFSLNVDSEIESLHAERTEHNRKHKDIEKKVVDIDGPVASTGHTHIEIVRKPGEKKIERTVDGLGLGLVDRDSDREVTREEERGTTHTTSTTGQTPDAVYTTTTTSTARASKPAKDPDADIDEQFDTSDL